MVRPNKQARAIIDAISYVAIATVNENGDPWNTPVARYHFDDDYTLYWASWAENQHSKNIRCNGKVFIVVYDSTPPNNQPSQGVYIQAMAEEVTAENEAIEAAKVFRNDPYNPSDGKEYLGNKPRRIYRAVPQKIWVNEDGNVNDVFVDVRRETEED